MRFIDNILAEVIIRLADNSSSFAEISEKLQEVVPRGFIPMVLRALEIFYEEKTYSLPPELIAAWKKYSGTFIRLDELDDMIDEFCAKYNLNKKQFLMWFNGEKRLMKKAEVNPELLARTVNFFIFRRIIRKATRIIAYLPRATGGSIVKEVLFMSKNLGANVNIRNESKIIIEILPGELSLEPLSVALTSAEIIEIFLPNGKKILIRDIPILATFRPKVFDSSLERIFYETMIKLKVKIRKDPPIVLDDLIFIPDFEVHLGTEKIYVEIVGYWRMEYLVNKEIKIRRALTRNIPLVVVASRRAYEYLRHLSSKTKFYIFDRKTDLKNIAKRILDAMRSRS